MKSLGVGCLLVIALSAVASARDIYVNNLAGDDRFDGTEPATQSARIGPCRTIRRALELAAKGDHIVLAASGEPYRESVTLQAGRHSGFGDRPFEIVGSGATLLGTAKVPEDAWKHVGSEVFRFTPPRKSSQLLFLDGKPAERVPVEATAVNMPELKPRQWCLFQQGVYFRTDAGRMPGSYALEYCALPVGITLYEVRHVVVRDLIVQGFQLDGINAHDGVFETTLQSITCRGNARSGISVGGASRVLIANCLLGGNGEAQLRTEGSSHTRMVASQLLDSSAPAIQSHGGSVETDPAAADAAK